MAWNAVASIGTSLLGGIFGSSGAKKQNAQQIAMMNGQNQFNSDQAAISRNFNADQALQQMAFQERMSNSAHQREIKDLEAAGLNPILSSGGSGASSPGGASASSPTASSASGSVVNESAELANSAKSMAEMLRQNPVLNAQVANLKAENQRINEQTKQLQISNAQQGVLTPVYMEAGKAVNSGISKVKDMLGIKDAGDVVGEVLDAAKKAPGMLASGDLNIPASAFDISRFVGTEDSEARKWARGEKPFLQSIFDASERSLRAHSAKNLTEEEVKAAGRRLLESYKSNASKPFRRD